MCDVFWVFLFFLFFVFLFSDQVPNTFLDAIEISDLAAFLLAFFLSLFQFADLVVGF